MYVKGYLKKKDRIRKYRKFHLLYQGICFFLKPIIINTSNYFMLFIPYLKILYKTNIKKIR